MRHPFGVIVALAWFCACDGGVERGQQGVGKSQPAEATKPEATKLEATAESSPQVRVVREGDAPTTDVAPTEDPGDLVVADPGKAYGQVLIKTHAGETHIAEFTIVRDEGVKARSGAVRYTAEPRVVVASLESEFDESNLLGTGMALDIDGDGKATSTIDSTCESGAVALKTEPSLRLEAVTALTEDVARFDFGPGDVRLLSNAHAGAVLYAPCDRGKVVMGLDPERPLKIHEVASPAAFVVYRAPVDSVDADDPFTLQEINAGEAAVEHEHYAFREFNVEGDTVKVYAAHLVVFELDPVTPLQHVSVKIAGEQPEFITVSINEVDADGKRIRYGDGFKPF